VEEGVGLGRSVTTDDVDGDGVRDVIAGTLINRIMVLFLATAGPVQGTRNPGAFIREAVWVGSIPDVQANCMLGSAMHVLPALT